VTSTAATSSSSVVGRMIVLIGGPMTVDDGSRLDSRQPIKGDVTSRITRKALASSWLWWSTVSSLATPLLDAEGPDACALIIGQRSIVDLRPDGFMKRSGLRGFLQGGVDELRILRTSMDEPLPEGYQEVTILRGVDGSSLGTVGIQKGKLGRRWQLLNGNEYYLTLGGRNFDASVVIDTDLVVGSDSEPTALSFQAFEERPFSDGAAIILPHTHSAERFFRGYVDWVRSDKPMVSAAIESASPNEWDPTAPPDPICYTHPVPIEADFQITALIQEGQWRDPSDLEAARSLLQARFDLNLGIWDLVQNPLLRRTLLHSKPTSVVPVGLSPVPTGAAARAAATVTTKLDSRAQAAEALRMLKRRMKPLRAEGWTLIGAGDLKLPLTDRLRRSPFETDAKPAALLWLSLHIGKRQTSISAATSLYNDIDLQSYVGARKGALEEIAGSELQELDRRWPVLWKADGGWADEVDWKMRVNGLASNTSGWVSLFEQLSVECRAVQARRFARE
jgi:hypothetical protein